MNVINEVINHVGVEYFMENISYSFDLETLHINQYPHTNSIFIIENEFLNLKWEN